ncbi:hypothetical protein ACFQ06_16470, partial [Tessaracoccus lubricantis]
GRLPAVDAWAETVERATGRRPTKGQRRRLLENWFRNALWSLSLAGWSDADVLRVARISAADEGKLKESLAGPGLVLALPHMGSWDLAGAWCARVGIKVVSVAERLPNGVYERFSKARAGMGMTIHPVDRPDLMRTLAEDVAAHRLVCLLADRDLSARGVRVPWPGADARIGVPAGPALLARRTGADLRVATTHFDGEHLRLQVSEPLTGSTAEELMTGAVAVFADAVRRHPESWLMLRRVFV